jgi:hypothetical protein
MALARPKTSELFGTIAEVARARLLFLLLPDEVSRLLFTVIRAFCKGLPRLGPTAFKLRLGPDLYMGPSQIWPLCLAVQAHAHVPGL